MKNQEAFVYCWTDRKTNMLYIGCHKGSQDDGYVCSSKWVLEEYKKRPEDFTRQIIAEGTQDDCLMLETSILKSVDAKRNPEYYNQHNGDGKFIPKKGAYLWPESRKKKHSERYKGVNNPFYGKKHNDESNKKNREAHLGKHHTEETRKLWSEQRQGEGNSNYGKHWDEEWKDRQREKMKGRKVSDETRAKQSMAAKGKKHPQKKVACVNCGTITIATNIKRWHNNCKKKPQ